MKRFCLICALIAVAAWPTPEVRAQSSAAAPGAAIDPVEQKKRLIDQKIRLLEMLLNSPAAKSAAYGTEAETTTLVAHGHKVIAEARQQAAEARYDEASKTLDEAMKVVTKATRRAASDTSFADSAHRQTYADQTEQIATYRKSVVDLTRDPKLGDAARTLLGRVDALTAEGAQLMTAGRLGEANKKLAEAYKLVTEDIARLRQGHVVVMSLKFDSPADEYAYEEKRFGSNRIMVDMMIAEGKGDGDKRTMIERYLNEAGQFKREAEGLAQNGRYDEAVKSMERANGQLVRALQVMGVPVF